MTITLWMQYEAAPCLNSLSCELLSTASRYSRESGMRLTAPETLHLLTILMFWVKPTEAQHVR
jgi:hypothetical protein